MIPEASVKLRPWVISMLPPDTLKTSGLTDREMGGVALGDASRGLSDWLWTVEVIDDNVVLTREGEPSITLLVQENIVDIALAFDQNMRPVIAWQDTTDKLFLRSYDGVTNLFVVMDMGTGRCPRLSLDDKRQIALSTNDVIFAYIREAALYYKQQRDRYLTEYFVATVPNGAQQLNGIGMGGLHFQFELSPNTEE